MHDNQNIESISIDYDVPYIENSESLYEIPISRIPSVDKIRKYNQDSKFQYKEPEVKKSNPDPNWFTKALNAIFRGISNFFILLFSSGVLTFVVIVLIVFVVLAIIMKIANINVKEVFSRKRKIDINESEILADESKTMGFEALIEDALKSQNFRLAIRYMYLRNLKALSDKNYINWTENKTNYSYQNEIEDKNIRDRFVITTRLFDYIWYGEFQIDESSFSIASQQLNDLNRMIIDGK